MFAIVFLSVIVLGVTKLQLSNLILSKTNVNEADAYFWANQGAEIVEGLGYGALTSTCAHPCTSTKRYLNQNGTDYELLNALPVPELLVPQPFIRTIILNDTGLMTAYNVTSRIEWDDNTGKHECDLSDPNDPKTSCVEVKRIIFQ